MEKKTTPGEEHRNFIREEKKKDKRLKKERQKIKKPIKTGILE